MDKYKIKIISIYIKNFKNIKSGYINLDDISNEFSVMKIISFFTNLVLNNRLQKNYKENILRDREEMSLILKLSISNNDKEQFIAVYSYTFLIKENLMKKESLRIATHKDNGEYSNYKTYFSCSLDKYNNFTTCNFSPYYHVKLRHMKSSYALVSSSKNGPSLLFSDVIFKTLAENKNKEVLNVLCILRFYVKTIQI